MARGKIYTNRKKTVRLGDEKQKQSHKSKKDKKAAQQKEEKKPVATDVFDYRTGVVYSIRPEDTDVQLMEAKVTSYLKEKGAIENPKDHLTTAVHLGDPSQQATPTSEPPTQSPPTTTTTTTTLASASQPEPIKVGMEKPDIPITFWREVKDVKTNNTYYWNPETNQTAWSLPENAVITSEASERSEKITDPENEDENTDLTKAYAYYAKTLYGVETGEVKGNGVSSPGEENTQKDMTTPNSTPTAKKNKKGKKQKIEDSPAAALTSGIVSPESSNLSQKGMKTRPKSTCNNSPSSISSPASSKQESSILRLQVSNTSDELFRKLEYLHVTSERISDLQKLHIQLETRMEDWKEEEISSKFFLSKLKKASDEVNTFVQREVPSGWTCVWDRASCRYYFSNSVSGEVSWEFPVANPDSVSSSVEVSESVEEEKGEGEDNEVDEEEQPQERNSQDQETSESIPDEEPVGEQNEENEPEPFKVNQVLTMPPFPPGPPPPPVENKLSVPTEANASTEAQEPPVLHTETNREEEIEEVEMEESQGKSVENREGNVKMDMVNDGSNDAGIAKADTPPMQLYDDIGPITNEEFEAEPKPEAVEEKEKMEEEDVNGKELVAEEPQQQEKNQEQITEAVSDIIDLNDKESGSEGGPGMYKKVGNREEEEEEEGELNSDYESRDYREYPSSYNKKQKKRSRYHSDSDDSYDGGRHKTSSSSKRSRRHRGNDYSDSDYSDEYYSKSSSRRRSRSKDRGYYRSDSEERYYKRPSRSSHGHSSKYGRDDSDNERYSSSKRSSRRQRSRSRSRDHGSREVPYSRKESKKKKKEKKKHKHRDSSSGDEYYSRKSKSKSSKDRDKDHDFSGSKNARDPAPKEPPPPMEKAFVPAKFKPKGKSREDMDESGPTATQLEMMQNIASVTGSGSSYMMNTYPMVTTDPQYAAYYAATGGAPVYDPNMMGQVVGVADQTQQSQLPQPEAVTQQQQHQQGADSVNEKVAEVQTSQETPGILVPSLPAPVTEPPPPPLPVVHTTLGVEDVSTGQTADAAQDQSILNKEASNGEEIMECEMELDDNDGELSQGDSDAGAIEKAAKETEVSKDVEKNKPGTVTELSAPAPLPPAPPIFTGTDEGPTDSINPDANVIVPTSQNSPNSKPEVESSTITATTTTTVTGDSVPAVTADTTATTTPSTEAPPTQSTVTAMARDVTPPIQDSTGSSQAAYTVSASSTTYSNPPTSYGYDPSQQAAYAAAYTQQFYNNPYQYYTDPAQYAAAMNYYAAYQAAYSGTYGAYYQQQALQQHQQQPSQNQPGGQKQ